MDYILKNTILYLDKVELGYGYGSNYKCILRDITFEEKDVVREGCITGQTIAIVGRSGRGKSTLFKALTGLVKPRTGQILIADGVDGDAKIVEEGDVGYVDQKYTLFRNKTVHQMLMAAQRKSGLSSSDKKEVTMKYLSEWELVMQKDQYPCELSGGQRQRTAIIEQILSAGHFMVLDEPFSGLDVGNIKSAKAAFDMIHKDHELNTIIYSTHNMKLAVELADSIYIVGHKEKNAEYSTIVKHYDLKEMGLAWQEFGSIHLDLLKELTHELENS